LRKKNINKATLIYEEIDDNEIFTGFALKDDRSIMNVTFNLIDEKYKSGFDDLLKENNISGINGHRSVGGYRASIYNAMEIESIEVLVDTMKKFKKSI
jgi:phosphoserine aminotransferase